MSQVLRNPAELGGFGVRLGQFDQAYGVFYMLTSRAGHHLCLASSLPSLWIFKKAGLPLEEFSSWDPAPFP